MFKVAILGTENLHALWFAEEILSGAAETVELLGIYGPEEQANLAILKLAEEAGVSVENAASCDAFVGRVDMVLITARHGDLHHTYAMPYLEAGIPCWIDKPFTVRRHLAKELIETARAHGTYLCGGSILARDHGAAHLRSAITADPSPIGTVLGGSVGAPIKWMEEFGGFYFYSQHLIGMMMSIFGKKVERVRAKRVGGSVEAIFYYDKFFVMGTYYSTSFRYTATVWGTEMSMTCQSSPDDVRALQHDELLAVERMLLSGGPDCTVEELVLPYSIMSALDASIRDGEVKAVRDFSLFADGRLL